MSELNQTQRLPRSSLRRAVASIPRAAAIAVSVALTLVAYGVHARRASYQRLATLADEQAIPSVALIAPRASSGEQLLTLPGDLQALYEAAIHARVSGYVREWRKDIGARVVAGELLATVDAPELDQQLEQAKGALAKAEANARLSRLTSKRWTALRASVAVSQQSADEKAGDVVAKDAETTSARANVEKLKALAGFTQIAAPFAGVVTARNVDIGALVSPSDPRDLFRVADIHQLRLYVRAPQSYAALLRPGVTAIIHAPQFADRRFTGRVTTTSNAIAQASRTFLVELLVENGDEVLWPGSYVEVEFHLPAPKNLLCIPVSALTMRDGAMTAIIVGSDNRAHYRKVDIERDLGSEALLRSGLVVSDRIIATPPAGIEDGDAVQPVGTAAQAEKGAEAKTSCDGAT
jgi:RND family efflux transporter MFP subunit